MKEKSLKMNVVLNMIRTISNMLFPLITFPYISRILSPEGLGKFDFASSVANYFILIAALGITQYAIREGASVRDNELENNQFSSEIFSINIISSVFAYVLLIILLMCTPRLQSYTVLILIFSLKIIFNLLSLDWLYTMHEEFLYITIRSIITQILSVILMFLFVKSKDDYIIYAWVTTLASGGASILNFINSRKFVKFKISFKKKLSVHLKPIFTLFISNIASMIYLNSDITVIGLISGNYFVGIYSTAVKIYTIVKQVSNAMLMTLIPRLSNYYHGGNRLAYDKLLNNTFWNTLTLVSPSMVGLIMLRKQIVLIIAGEKFLKSVDSLSILSVGLFLSIIAAFFVHGILLVQKREGLILKVTVWSAVLNLILNFILVPFIQERGAAIATVISEFFIIFVSYRNTKSLFKIDISYKKMVGIVLGCIFIVFCCMIVSYFIKHMILQTFVSIIVSVLGYMGILYLFKALPTI